MPPSIRACVHTNVCVCVCVCVCLCMQEAKRFQAFLKSRLQRTEEDQSALDQVLKDENDRAWAAKEAVWDANRRQKEALAAEVADGMASQVQRHKQDALDIEAEKQQFKMEQRLKYKLGVEADKEKERKKQVEVDAYRASLRVDIDLKKVRRAEVAQLVEERKEMALANEKFDANLKAVMGSHYQPPEHYRKKKSAMVLLKLMIVSCAPVHLCYIHFH